MRSAGCLAGLRFEFWHSFVIVGNVLVLGFATSKISAILGKVSAILVLCRLGSILRRPAVDLCRLEAACAVLGCIGPSWGRLCQQVGAKWGPSGRLGRVLDRLWTALGRLGATLAPSWTQVSAQTKENRSKKRPAF